MEKAIRKSIEGGYLKNSVEIYKGEIYTFGEKIIVEKVLLDPAFWQALGKSEGWEGKIIKRTHTYTKRLKGRDIRVTRTKGYHTSKLLWKKHALKFHEINLTEGWDAAVKYLESLLSN